MLGCIIGLALPDILKDTSVFILHCMTKDGSTVILQNIGKYIPNEPA